jgi:activating signal cointegrator 1
VSEVRALTIHEPYASLIINKLKRFETRGRKTHIRGLVAIHAAKKLMDEEGAEIAEQYGLKPQYGKIVGIVDLTDCIPSEQFGELLLHPEEIVTGDFSDGRYAWEMKVKEKFENPIPAKGQQGFWYWEA